MLIRQFRHFTTTGSTLQETFLYQERFIDFFHRTGVFTQSRGDGGQAYRTAIELIDNTGQYLGVDFIQAISLDIHLPILRLGGLSGSLYFLIMLVLSIVTAISW